MSYKSKNLSYEAKEPAFLRRLRGQHGDVSERDPDRHERPEIRPRGTPRNAGNDDDDDAPTYVDAESNQTLSKEEYEKMMKSSADSSTGQNDIQYSTNGKLALGESKESPKIPVQKSDATLSVGAAQRKRKAVKIGNGSDSGEDYEQGNSDIVPRKEAKSKPQRSNDGTKTGVKKPKKKAKAVVLSFDDQT